MWCWEEYIKKKKKKKPSYCDDCSDSRLPWKRGDAGPTSVHDKICSPWQQASGGGRDCRQQLPLQAAITASSSHCRQLPLQAAPIAGSNHCRQAGSSPAGSNHCRQHPLQAAPLHAAPTAGSPASEPGFVAVPVMESLQSALTVDLSHSKHLQINWKKKEIFVTAQCWYDEHQQQDSCCAWPLPAHTALAPALSMCQLQHLKPMGYGFMIEIKMQHCFAKAGSSQGIKAEPRSKISKAQKSR